MSNLRLLLLGSPQLIVDGRSLNIGRRKDMALLAYLAVTAERHTRDALSTLLWPEIDQSRSRAALRKTLYRLRQQVDDWLDITAEEIGMQPSFELDVAQVKQLAINKPTPADILAASDLYRGEFMTGFTLPDCPEFDRWQYFQADEIRRTLMQALLSLIDYYIDEGQYNQGIVTGRRLLSLDPLHEAAHRLLMKCYVWAGQRGAALRQYQDCLQLLDEELGVTPDPETAGLYQQIKNHQLPVPVNNRPAESTIVPSFIDLHSLNPLVGRQSERKQIAALVEAAAASQGQLLLVDGEPGIGKSRLLQEAVVIAQQQNLHTLWLNCYQVEQDIPYQPVAEMIDQGVSSWPWEIFQALPLSALADIATLVPEIANIVPSLPQAPGSQDESKRARLFRSLTQLIAMLANPNGLLLIFEDIHWADHATLQFLHYLARHLTGQAILLIISFRGSDQRTELTAVLDGLTRQGQAVSIHLERLTAEDVTQLAQTLAPAAGPELSRWLYRETQGNPLFLNAILQSLPEEILTGDALPDERRTATNLPETLIKAIRDRLRWLPNGEGRILEFAAVIGRRFRFDLLQALTDERTLTLLEAVENLVQRQLLREERDGRYDFTHNKIREVIYQDMNQVRRRLMHLKVAETMEQSETLRLRELAGVLATHFEQAGEWGKAIQYLVMAADHADRLFALQEASSAYNRALELAETHPTALDDVDRLRLRQGRGKVRALLVDFEGAIRDLHIALDLSRQLELPDARRETLLQLGMIHRRSDNYQQAIAHLIEALTAAESSGDEGAVADILFHLGTVVWSQGDNHQATTYHEQAVSIVQRLSLTDWVAMQAYHGRAEAYYLEGNQPQAERYFRRSLKLARQLGDKAYEAENLLMLAVANTAFLGGANYALALKYGKQARAVCQEYHLDWHLMPVLTTLGVTLAVTGNYEEGLNLSQQGIRLAEETGNRRYLAVALFYHGYLLLDLNLWSEAIAHLEQAIAIAEPVNAGHPLLRGRAHLAIARLRSGELDAGQALVDILQEARRYRRGIVAAHCLAGLAEWAIETGDAAMAGEYATQLLAVGQAGSMREMIVQANLWQGESRRLSGQLAEAAEMLNLAANDAEQIGRIRLSWDIHAALTRLYVQKGQNDLAQLHKSKAKAMISSIAASLTDPNLRAGLPHYPTPPKTHN